MIDETIDVITPMYNASASIGTVYNCLRKQGKNLNWYVVDDCSTDGSVAALLQLFELDEGDNNITLHLQVNSANRGAAYSRNKAINNGDGKIIAFLDADDEWLADKLHIQLRLMQQNNIFLAAHGFERVNGNLSTCHDIVGTITPVTYSDLLNKKYVFLTSSVMLRRSLLADRRFSERIVTGQDHLLWLTLLKDGGSGFLLPDTLVRYNVIKNSLSSNKMRRAKYQYLIYRELRYNLLVSLILTLKYALVSKIRYLFVR